MELSAEDALRLNVMLANPLQAVRIDESSMTVHALSGQGSVSVKLNPRGRDDMYLRKVRELLSSQVLGSPGGYPVYLRRWTRMGQARDQSLEQLLLLGEPEAVVAVVHARGLTDEIARRAWWAMPVADNARRMLERECIVQGAMGSVLAEYLVDYLPFETEHRAMIETVQLVLQPGLISAESREKLWKAARRKNTYYVGFLGAMPDRLPEPLPPRSDYPRLEQALAPLAAAGNPVAAQILRCADAAGQTFLSVAEIVLNKPNNQDVVVELLKTLQSYFSGVRPPGEPGPDMSALVEAADALCNQGAPDAAVRAVLEQAPELRGEVIACLVLAWLGEQLVNPIFARTDAIGSVMRKKIEPVIQPIREQFAQLRGRAG
jgi:hypothetical protein